MTTLILSLPLLWYALVFGSFFFSRDSFEKSFWRRIFSWRHSHFIALFEDCVGFLGTHIFLLLVLLSRQTRKTSGSIGCTSWLGTCYIQLTWRQQRFLMFVHEVRKREWNPSQAFLETNDQSICSPLSFKAWTRIWTSQMWVKAQREYESRMRNILGASIPALLLCQRLIKEKRFREKIFSVRVLSPFKEKQEGNKSECLQSNYLHILMTFSLSCLCCLKCIPYGTQLQDFTGCQCRKEIPDIK